MKTILAICFLLTAATSTVTADHVIDESEKPQYLYVMSATSGSFDGETLTLTGVPSVVYFSDRPYRIAGHMSLEKFIEGWDKGSDSFKADPPNATLSISNEKGNKDVVVELSDLQSKGDTIIFKVHVLKGDAPAFFKAASLFMDYSDRSLSPATPWGRFIKQ